MVQDYRSEVQPKMRMVHQWGYLSAEGVMKHSIQVLELDLMPITAYMNKSHHVRRHTQKQYVLEVGCCQLIKKHLGEVEVEITSDVVVVVVVAA